MVTDDSVAVERRNIHCPCNCLALPPPLCSASSVPLQVGANAGLPVDAETRRRARVVDPPDRGEPVREDEEGLIAAAFPSIFPYGDGDYNAVRPQGVSFETWIRHVLLFGDHRAMRHKRFRYWAFNTWLRRQAQQMRAVYYRQNPGDKDLTPEMLRDLDTRRALVKLGTYLKNHSRSGYQCCIKISPSR